MVKTVIPALSLPDVYPFDKAIISSKKSKSCYEPHFWEFEYQIHRYLSNLSTSKLLERYRDIAKNFSYIVSPERHVIPLQSFLSSWYWYRKEHQTRLELHLRKQDVPFTVDVPIASVRNDDPRRPLGPNSCDILYRFARDKYIAELASEGLLRMSVARSYKGMENDSARQDDEMNKASFLNGKHTKVYSQDGKEIPVIGDIAVSHSGPLYYLLCLSCDWDRRLFDDFMVNSCAVIYDVEEFALRLEKSVLNQMPSGLFFHNPVEYFDPYERHPDSLTMHDMTKDFKFAYQREYRFLVTINPSLPNPPEFLDIKMGSMADCLEVFPK